MSSVMSFKICPSTYISTSIFFSFSHELVMSILKQKKSLKHNYCSLVCIAEQKNFGFTCILLNEYVIEQSKFLYHKLQVIHSNVPNKPISVLRLCLFLSQVPTAISIGPYAPHDIFIATFLTNASNVLVGTAHCTIL